jgi:ryanodine receptor 2
VYIGWVTTQYHLHSHDFKQENVRRAAIIVENEYEQPIEQSVKLLLLMIRSQEI